MTTKLKPKQKKRPVVRWIVTNEEFSRCWGSAQTKAIVSTAGEWYRQRLPSDIYLSACQIAVWKALGYYNPKKGQTFTSSLYTIVKWELGRDYKRWMRLQDRPGERVAHQDEAQADVSIEAKEEVNKLLLSLSPFRRKIITGFYLEGKTERQLAKRWRKTTSEIRTIIASSLRELGEHGNG